MTIRGLLASGRDALVAAEVDSPLLDAMVLLAHAMGATKERLLASLPDEADGELARRYGELIGQRSAGRPVSYIRRLKEFWGLEFYVDEAVLVPRPDTETLVERALFLARADESLRRIHDACTGSGCVAIALARELPGRVVTASDVSTAAERVFELNCTRLLGRQLPFFTSDLLAETPGPYDLITANPPYLADGEADDLAAIGWPEPDLALRGGPDGTTVAARLVREAP
jgi:release factor glutamine methyltransferase